MAAKRDYYEVLGVPKSADKDAINKAYRKLALKYHPDRNRENPKEAEIKFKEVTEAYQVLSEPQQRQAYDQFGHEGMRGFGRAGASEGFGGGGGFGGVGDIFSEVFGDIFGTGEGRRAGVHRGHDLKFDLNVDFLDAVFGAEKVVTIPKQATCETCHGSGADPKHGVTTCKRCRGAGQISFRQGFFSINRTCDACHGEGQVIEKPCSTCRGSGTVDKKSKLNIKIPAGIRTGQKLKMSGEGAAAPHGGHPGDLYVEVHVGKHEVFERKEDDIHLEYPITLEQAILGAEITIPTLHGNVSMKIPPGTQSGKQFRIKKKGVAHVEGYGFGDQLVKVIVEVPTQLSREQKELLEKFMRSMGRENHPLTEEFLRKVTASTKK